MYLHEDQIFVLNHNLLLSNQAQEEFVHSMVDRAEIFKGNIKVSMNKRNGCVVLWGRGGGKVNVQVSKEASFDLQGIGFSFRERVSQEDP